ncbi:MAG: hypothetical protein RPR97_08635, partial [Colwellia sp.]
MAPLAMAILPVCVFLWGRRFSKFENLDRKLIFLFFCSILYSLLSLLVFHSFDDLSFMLDRGGRFVLIAMPSILFFLFFHMFSHRDLQSAGLVFSCLVGFIYILNLFVPELFNSVSFF